jgi:predicted nucleotide-binding protein
MGSRVFIGHGGSPQWRELKEYIQDKLGVPVDEFNRVPVAGLTTGARLSEMLNNAAMAFLVMTAEDETPDGKYAARQNVVHEVGLFQGKLGFEKAIVMLEEGCEEFSNIHGLNQVRFPAGNISAKFHEVHELLKREKLL